MAIDLAAFAGEHLYYEALMYVAARDKLFQMTVPQNWQPRLSGPDPIQALERNLLIECCVLHFRNLVDFFYTQFSSQRDDVNAAHYVAGWGKHDVPPVINDARIRANKEMAHLTSERRAGAPQNKAWNFVELSNAMTLIIADFIKMTDPSMLPQRTKAVLERIGGAVTVTGGPVFTSSTSV